MIAHMTGLGQGVTAFVLGLSKPVLSIVDRTVVPPVIVSGSSQKAFLHAMSVIVYRDTQIV